ncbi:hypothetical protein EQV97_28705 [Pseudomonas sp. TMW22090]|jgi:hypothetical protein|nr:hypothetical protein [Pseudomonas sp. TMW22090]
MNAHIQSRKESPLSRALAVSTLLLACTGLLLSGCQNSLVGSTAVGGVLGCIGGAAIAAGTGGNPGTGCAIGAALGAPTGYYVGRQKDLENARQAKAAIERQSSDVAVVQLTTRQEAVPADKRNDVGAASVESMDSMQVNVPQALVKKRDNRLKQPLSQVGNYVSSASSKANIVVTTRSKSDFNYIVANIKKGYTGKVAPDKVTYEYRELTRGTQSAIQVMPSAQV